MENKSSRYTWLNKLFLTVFSGLCLFFAGGCEDAVSEVKAPKIKSKLVVGCFISPQDSLVTVTVWRSVPIYNTVPPNSLTIDQDALVVLSDGTHMQTLPYNASQARYSIDTALFPIRAGGTYYLTVRTPDGESTSAQCTVPRQKVDYVRATVKMDTIYSSGQQIIIPRYDFTWQDFPGQRNYYRTCLEFGYDASLYDDISADGDSLRKVVRYSNGSNRPLDFYLIHADEMYYLYYQSIKNYTGAQPFTEPSFIYSNIKGGLGIFCAYQLTHVKI